MLKYIYSLKDETKYLIEDKFFKKSKDISEIQKESLNIYCTIDQLKYNIPDTNYKFMNIEDDVLKFLVNKYTIEKVVNQKCYKWSKENDNLPIETYPPELSDLN